MSSDAITANGDGAAITVADVSKCYHIYARPQDRLREAILPRLRRWFGLSPRRYFSEFWSLREVGFRIDRGETVAIIGKNGSGKSTLLQVICGTLTPTGGDVAVQGRVAALLELGSGFNPEFTGRENVYLNGSVLGLTRQQVDERFEAIVAFADIGEFIDQPVKTYSSGMYVRLAFAVIANVDADILIVDEALSVGDVFFGQKCMRFLREFQARGTLIFVSHDSAAVVNLCKRAIWLDHGRILMDGPAREVSQAYRARAYGMDVKAGAGPKDYEDGTDEAFDAPALALDRSEIRVFRFQGPSANFGDGRAKIVSVSLHDGSGAPLSTMTGGEPVVLRVRAQVESAIENPIVGFFLKDRLGQQLFGTHTYHATGGNAGSAAAGQYIRADFAFRMPYLPVGKYTVDVALADGSHHEHVQNDWAFDSLVLESVASSISVGLVGIPYQSVSLTVGDAAANP